MDTEETFFLSLKSHRESKGIEIDEISDYTKINPKYLHAIEEGSFNIIPNIYMRLFLRSYTRYIEPDSEQALVDYELHTTGKVQPKFFENEYVENQTSNNKKSPAIGFDSSDEFQINYKQIATIVLTVIGIYASFKLIEFISNDNSSEPQSNESIMPSSSIYIENDNADLALLDNQRFKNSILSKEVTEILPLSSSSNANFTIKTLNKTKINILTHQQDGSVFF